MCGPPVATIPEFLLSSPLAVDYSSPSGELGGDGGDLNLVTRMAC